MGEISNMEFHEWNITHLSCTRSQLWVKYHLSFVYMFAACSAVSEISPTFCVHVHNLLGCEWGITDLSCTHSQLTQLRVKYHPSSTHTFSTYSAVSEVSPIFHVHIHSLLNCVWNITHLPYTRSQLTQFLYHLYVYETSWLCWNLVGDSSLVFLHFLFFFTVLTKKHTKQTELCHM